MNGRKSETGSIDTESRTSPDPWSISYKQPDPVSGSFPGGRFTLGVACSFSDSQREMRLTEAVKFHLTFTEPATLGVQNDFVYWIQNLFTFATDHPNAITELVVQKLELSGDYIAVVGPRIFSDEGAAADLMPWQMLFSLSDIKDRFGEMVAKWFELSKRYPEATALYFGTVITPRRTPTSAFNLLSKL